MKVSLVPTELIDGLRAWFHPKDRSVVLASSCFIEGQEIVTPGTPVAGRRRLYAKSGCWYDLGSNGTETGLCVSGVDPAGHTHSKIVASDGAPDQALSADASGYLAAAVQPLFSAYLANTASNVTGDGTNYTLVCDTEITDRNSNYNTGTGVFTAPVTAKILFICEIFATDIAVGHTVGAVSLVTSNRTYYLDIMSPAACKNSNNQYSKSVSQIADLDAGDTAYFVLNVNGGAKTIDVLGAATVYTAIQGYMLM